MSKTICTFARERIGTMALNENKNLKLYYSIKEVAVAGRNREEQVAGLLHDVVEDTEMSFTAC